VMSMAIGKFSVAMLGFGAPLFLSGCGSADNSSSTDTTTARTTSLPTTSTVSHTGTGTTTSTTITMTTTTTTNGKTKLYVVARMDDVSVVDHSEVAAAVINWFREKRVKLNFGIIMGNDGDRWQPVWPATCQASPMDENCDDPAVRAVNDAYTAGDVLGTGEKAVLEIGNHAWNHNSWGGSWLGYQPKDSWKSFVRNDFSKSQGALTAAFPKASIRYFAAPTNMMDAYGMKQMKNVGLDIVSAQGTMKCPNSDIPLPPFYDYYFTPCMTQHRDGSFQADCVPENDIWATEAGFAHVGEDMFSVPVGSANSFWPQDMEGISVEQTIGEGDIGCYSDPSRAPDGMILENRTICSIIGSAIRNANKSNGLHWTGLMMHPQTLFGSQSYTEWLDEFYEKVTNLKDWDVQFINMQDVPHLSAPAVSSMLLV